MQKNSYLEVMLVFNALVPKVLEIYIFFKFKVTDSRFENKRGRAGYKKKKVEQSELAEQVSWKIVSIISCCFLTIVRSVVDGFHKTGSQK